MKERLQSTCYAVRIGNRIEQGRNRLTRWQARKIAHRTGGVVLRCQWL